MIAEDRDEEWIEVPSLPRPISLTPVPGKGTVTLDGDGVTTLWIPSSIPTELRSGACVEGLAAKEVTLRVADCSDSLHNIRRSLRELSAFSSFKRKNVDGPGQHIQTRALGTLKALRDKRDRYVSRYRRSHAAWLALDPDQTFDGGKWRHVLRVLKQSDLTFPGDDEEEDESEDDDTISAARTLHNTSGMGGSATKRRGEGHTRLTWIWRVQSQDARDIPGLDDNASEEDVYKRRYVYL